MIGKLGLSVQASLKDLSQSGGLVFGEVAGEDGSADSSDRANDDSDAEESSSALGEKRKEKGDQEEGEETKASTTKGQIKGQIQTPTSQRISQRTSCDTVEALPRPPSKMEEEAESEKEATGPTFLSQVCATCLGGLLAYCAWGRPLLPMHGFGPCRRFFIHVTICLCRARSIWQNVKNKTIQNTCVHGFIAWLQKGS